MPPTSPIELTIFDYVDDFARRIRAGSPTPSDVVEQGDAVMVFCEALFAQVFKFVLGCPIKGFDADSKRRAAALAERGEGPWAESASLRALVALFESFCDMYQEVVEGSYGAADITFGTFHERYLSRLLDRALAWAREVPYQDLADRITVAQFAYADATGAMRW